MILRDDVMTFSKWNGGMPSSTFELSKEDVRAFLETDQPLGYADTMSENLLALTCKWKYGIEDEVRIWTNLPYASQRNIECHVVPSRGWPRELLEEAIAVNHCERLTREMIKGYLPSIGY